MAPTAASIGKKKSTAGKRTLGVRRQAPPPGVKEKPEGMTKTDWELDVLRRRLETQSRGGRRAKERARKLLDPAEPLTAKKLAAMNQVFTLGASQESAPTLRCKTGGSSSNSSFFAESTVAAGTLRSRFSPEYADSQYHSGFDPNVVFPSCGLDLNRLVDLSSLDLRRYPADPR